MSFKPLSDVFYSLEKVPFGIRCFKNIIGQIEPSGRGIIISYSGCNGLKIIALSP